MVCRHVIVKCSVFFLKSKMQRNPTDYYWTPLAARDEHQNMKNQRNYICVAHLVGTKREENGEYLPLQVQLWGCLGNIAILSLERKEIFKTAQENLITLQEGMRTCLQEGVESFVSNLSIRFTATRWVAHTSAQQVTQADKYNMYFFPTFTTLSYPPMLVCRNLLLPPEVTLVLYPIHPGVHHHRCV